MRNEADSVRQAIVVMIAVLCAAALVLIVAIADSPGSGGDTTDRVIASALALTVFSLSGFAGWTLARSDNDAAFFGYFTVVVSVLALASAFWAIVAFDPFEGDSTDPLRITAIFAIAGGQASALLAGARPDDGDPVRVTRVLTVLAIAALSVMVAVEISSPGPDLSPKAFGIVSVLYLLGTFTLPLLRQLRPTDE